MSIITTFGERLYALTASANTRLEKSSSLFGQLLRPSFMPVMRFFWFRLLCCSLSGNLFTLDAHAQAGEDHLEPPKGYYTSGQSAYYTKVPTVLFAGLRGTPLARVVVLPSLLPEYVLSLDRQAGTVYLTYQRTQQTSIWQELQAKTGVTPALDTHAIALEPALATALTQVFAAAIGQTRYPKPSDTVTMRGDGITFTFLYMQPHVGWQAGETWSPLASTQMGRLVALIEHMRQLATKPGGPSMQADLLAESKQLAGELVLP